jgi:hypothetical protein
MASPLALNDRAELTSPLSPGVNSNKLHINDDFILSKKCIDGKETRQNGVGFVYLTLDESGENTCAHFGGTMVGE